MSLMRKKLIYLWIDVIGYRLEGENVEKKDDFQTKEDEEVRSFEKVKNLKSHSIEKKEFLGRKSKS